ncbi:MAG TPA: APC family permease [Gemmatimonadales bacterium]
MRHSIPREVFLALPRLADPPIRAGQLLRVLGAAFGVAVIIGNTIGVGILRTPGDIAARLPTPSLFLAIWVVGGIYALLGAISVAELGAMIPRSGGQYVFVRHALGGYAGFVVGWSDWISTAGSAALMAMVIGEYLEVLVPATRGYGAAVAAAVVSSFAVLYWRGIQWGDKGQQSLSLLKAAALAVLVVACFAVGSRAPQGTPLAVPTGTALATAIIVSLQGVIYTYDGWNGMTYFSGEVKNPGRDIPRAMAGGVLFVLAIYLLINLAILYVLPISRMAGDPFVAGTAASVVFGPAGDTVIRTIMIVSALGAVSACQLMAPRVILAMSSDGLMPAAVRRVNAGGTPTVATVVSTGVALAFIATGTFDRALSLIAFFFVANYLMSFVSVFVLRRREPDAPRPYRAWGYPWTTGIALVGSIAFLVGQSLGDTRNSLWSLGLLALSYPLYLAIRSRSISRT